MVTLNDRQVVRVGDGFADAAYVAGAKVWPPAGSTMHFASTSQALRHRVHAINATRGVNQLVVYSRPTYSTSPASMWGCEVIVVGGAVTAVLDRQITGGPPAAVPAGGFVLSGHGTARMWINNNVTVGQKIVMSHRSVAEVVPTPTYPPDTRAPVPGASTVAIGAQPAQNIAVVNGTRVSNAIAMYTPGLFTEVPADRFGFDVVVTGGQVSSIHDRATSAEDPMVFPMDGSHVLSFHGTSRTWALANVTVGAAVSYTGPAASLAVDSAALRFAAPAASSSDDLPATVCGAYMDFSVALPLAKELPRYNVKIAAFARGGGGQTMTFAPHANHVKAALISEIAASHARGERWLLSLGGGGAPVTVIQTTAHADAVFAGMKAIIDEYGFRGVAYNLENGPDGFTPAALLHLSQRFRDQYGSSFAITMAPRPYETYFFDIAAQHHAAGLLSMVNLQFYDVPGFYDVPEAVNGPWLSAWVAERLAAVAARGVPRSKLAVGGTVLRSYANGSGDAGTYFSAIEPHVPGIKGTFVWDAAMDRDSTYSFIRTMRGL